MASTVLSVVANYFIVVVLTWLHVYSQEAIIFIVGVELAVILGKIYEGGRLNCFVQSSEVGMIPITATSTILMFRFVAFGGLAFVLLNLGNGAFSTWDAVVSWNRWAKDWFNGLPSGTSGYPPGLPILYSIVYRTAGTTDIQDAAKIMVSYFPFVGLFSLWRISIVNNNFDYISSIAGAAYVYLILNGNGEPGFPFSGYADPLIAALSAYCLYLLFVWRRCVSDQWVIGTSILNKLLAICALAAPSIIKQNGAVASSLFFAIALCIGWNRAPKHRMTMLLWSLAGILLTFHWYIYSFFRWNDFVHATELLEASLPLRLLGAAKLTIGTCSPVLIGFIAIGSLNSRLGRQIFLFVISPLWIFWAVMVSYDFRSAYFLIPGLALLAGIGAELALKRLNANRIIAIFRFKLNSPDYLGRLLLIAASFIFIILFILPHSFPAEKFLALNYEKRIRANDKGYNRQINSIFFRSGSTEKTVSAYALLYNLPDAEGKFVIHMDYPTIHSVWLSRSDIKYLIWELYPPPAADVEIVRQSARAAQVEFRETRLGDQYIIFEKI